MLGNVLFSLSLTIAVLALLDIYLSDRQKRAITDGTTRIWNWLDDLSELSFLEFLRQRSVQWIIVILAVLTGVAVLVISGSRFEHAKELQIELLLVLGLTLLTPLILRYVLSPKSTVHVIVRAVAIILFYAIAAIAALYLLEISTRSNDGIGMYAGLSNLGVMLGAFIVAIFYLWVLFLSLVSPLVMVGILRAVLGAVELTVRRIVEYPKGPILAGSALAGVAVMIVKSF